MKYWVVRGSPAENGDFAFVRAGKTGRWRTGQPPKGWTLGDRLFFWASSPRLELIALGEFRGETGQYTEEGQCLYKVRYFTGVIGRPLRLRELRYEPELQNAIFLKVGPAASVVRLTPAEGAHLYRLVVAENAPVAGIWPDLEDESASLIDVGDSAVFGADVTPGDSANLGVTYRIGRHPTPSMPHNADSWRKIADELGSNGPASIDRLTAVCKGHLSGSKGAPHARQFVLYCIKQGWLVGTSEQASAATARRKKVRLMQKSVPPDVKLLADPTALLENEESRFPEGTAKFALHRRLERDTMLARHLKEKRLEGTGKLVCEICDFDFVARYGMHGLGFIEAHHTMPVSRLSGKTRTQESDLILVCSNCHRMLHRGPQLLSPSELRSLMRRGGKA
ncbi:MAG: HNH endonuclease [Rhodanobacter sp.]